MERTTNLADSAIEMLHALEVTAAAHSQAGPHRIELVTIFCGWVCLQPVHLPEGEEIPQEFALDLPLDHHMTTPGYTVWSGDRDGLDMQARAALQRPVEAPL